MRIMAISDLHAPPCSWPASLPTSRRSAVTSLYNTGLFDAKDIMSISGHTTLKNFETYIRRGAIEQAESIAEKFAKAKEVTLKTKEA